MPEPTDMVAAASTIIVAHPEKSASSSGLEAPAVPLAEQARDSLPPNGHSGTTRADIDRWLAGDAPR